MQQHLEDKPLQESPTYTSPVTVFVLGILAIAAFSFFTGIPAIVLGKRTLGAMQSGEYSDRNKPLAEAGVLMGWIGVFLGSVVLLVIAIYFASPGCGAPNMYR